MYRVLLATTLLLSVVNLGFSEEVLQVPAMDDNTIFPNETIRYNVGPERSRFYNCNYTVCSLPCEGAAAPPSCPDKLPYCVTGCACIRYCHTPNIICFETKHCIHPKKQFIKRRRI